MKAKLYNLTAGAVLLFTFLFGVIAANAQNNSTPFRVSGTVNSQSSNTALQGVTVTLQGTATATSTNDAGQYEINVPGGRGTLVFSYVGYAPIERPVNNQARIDVTMTEGAGTLEQVVVVGYGTQKKVNLTGAISAITAEDIRGRPVTATSSALQGLMPGVTIRNTTGLPGQNGSTIRIRGIGTLGDANPLVVIDGIPGGDMNIINPDDIESISVLKDAASSSIYGVRGANGVILITTKKGRAGTQSLTYSNYLGYQTPTALPEFLGSPEYMTLLNEAQRNVGRTITYTEADIEKARNGSDLNYFANTNWMKEIYKERAGQQNHNISLNGGGNNLSYYVSYGYLNQDGLVTGDNFGSKRNNVRLRLNTKLINRIDLDFNMGYVDRKYMESSDEVSAEGGPIQAAHVISPMVPVKFTTGGWGYLGGSRNPVAVTTDGGYNDFGSQELTGNINAAINLFEGFRLRGQYGLIKSNSRREILYKTINYYNPTTGARIYQTNFPNKIDNRDYTNTYQTFIATADYEKTFNIHEFKVLLGASQETNLSESFTASRTNLVSEDVSNINLGTLNQLNSGNDAHTALQSLFGRINYVLDKKYLAEVNFRYDGSSRFGKDVRWNLFPSASVGWRLSEEKFFNSLKGIFREVKLRASYGELGNDKVGNDYAYLSTIGPVSTMPIGNVLTPAYAQTGLPNQILTWETVIKKNIGLDLVMLRGRLGLTADYFIHNTDDILLRVTLPDVLGATEPSQNAGKVENKGWEFQLDWKDRIGKDIRYGFNFNISDVKNKVVSLGGVPPSIGDQVRFLGEPIDAFYGLVAERLAQTTDFDYNATTNVYTPKFAFISGDKIAPGDIIYKDLSGPDGKPDGKITLADDRQVIGNPFPRYTYAFRGDLGWKGFDFNFFLQGVGKASGYIKGAGRHAYINESTNPQTVHLDRWTPDNTDASYPRFTYQLSHNQRLSTYWLENAAYLRIKNIQLGYTLPARVTERLRISRLRVFASADNLFTRTNFFYAYDPETPVSTGGYYPQVKTFIIGLNLNLK